MLGAFAGIPEDTRAERRGPLDVVIVEQIIEGCLATLAEGFKDHSRNSDLVRDSVKEGWIFERGETEVERDRMSRSMC